MSQHEWLLFWVIGLIALGLWAAISYWSRDARMQRRRRKSHSRIVSKTAKPSVRFSVRIPSKKPKK